MDAVTKVFAVCLVATLTSVTSSGSNVPIVITTWNFKDAADAAWEEINKEGSTALDAIEVR